ncbi:MAG: glycoside hydrolase family 3 protein [Candidatus Caenarcaniphilales bacterium]|nr:glycoside hydrolase family 3 protein [Candidatus Caenarcaniphilales bacterium]
MTLLNKLKISNLFIVGFEGTILTDEISEKLLRLRPAGIILFDTNIESRPQVQKLIKDLKNLLGEKLLISVDQEGGKVERLRKVSPSLCSLYALGKASSELNSDGSLSEKSVENLKTHTRLLALDLIDLGFNLVFAPCADLNSNSLNPIIGTRSLGEDSNLIAKQLSVIINEFKNYPLLHCAKHFPGHGDAKIDSHLALPEIDLSDLTKFESHLQPFKKAISLDTDSVMVAHATFKLPPKIIEELKLEDEESFSKLPASINPKLIKSFLCKHLSFSNLVISDEITMKALSHFGDYESIAKQMIHAGNDLVIWNTNIDEALEVCDAELSSELLNSIKLSFEKIDRFHEFLSLRVKTYQKREELDQEIDSLYLKQQDFLKELFCNNHLQDFNEPDLILCFDHHKIENFVLSEIFPNVTIDRFNNKSNLTIILDRYRDKKILVFSFLAYTNPKQREQINVIKKSSNQVLEIACDYPDSEAHINLLAFNKVHIEALRQSKE